MSNPIISGVNSIFSLFYIIILIRCFLSFIPSIDWNKQPFFTIRQVTDAYLDLFRRFIPPIGMLDISPIVAILALGVIQNIVLMLLVQLFGNVGI